MTTLRQKFHDSVGGLSPVFWVIWWGTLVNRLASFVGTFLALYLVQEHGFDAAAAGRVVALWGLGSTIAAPVGGVFTDRIGRRATMITGLVCSAFLVIAIAFTHSPALISLLVFLGGGAGQVYFPASNAAIADVVPPLQRPRAFGLIYWAINLGLALGFAIAGVVASRSLFALFLADAATTLIFALLIAVKVPETSTMETRASGQEHGSTLYGLLKVFQDGPYVTFLFLHVIALTIFTQFQLALPLDMAAHGIGPSGFSLLMAFNCVGVVLLQPVLAPILHRFDGAHLLSLSTFLFAVGYGLYAVANDLALYVVGSAFWTVGEVVGFPVAASLVADLAPLPIRGRYQGAFSMIWGIALTFSPVVGGEILSRFGSRTHWLLCLAVGVLVALAHLAVANPRRRRLDAIRIEQGIL